MQPLDDFYYFAQVIEHGGYARASRALNIPKSRLSRHVTALEARLGVRLVNRSTRRFVVTEVGHEVHKHAMAMLSEADAAVEAVEFARAEPCGVIKVSCPVALAQGAMAEYLPDFLSRYPRIRLMLHATNRRVDVINEGFDVALRVRTIPTGEDGLVMRTFGSSSNFLVASPKYLAERGRPGQPDQIAQHSTLSFDPDNDRQLWELFDEDGASVRIDHTPRLVCHDFIVMRTAVLAGLGIALLPESVIRADVDSGKLEQVLPAWTLPLGVFHLVFPTRRGLLPSVRAFIDFLAERMPRVL